MQKVVVFDMDDVLVDLLHPWVEYLNEKYNLNVKYEDILEWEMHKAFPRLTAEQLYGPLYDINLWWQVKPRPGAVEAVEKLQSLGYKVLVATASHFDSLPLKLKHSLLPHFTSLCFKDIIMCHEKQLIKCDYIVDDNIQHLVGHNAVKFLMSAPHNKHIDTSLFDYRVSTPLDVVDIIERLEQYR